MVLLCEGRVGKAYKTHPWSIPFFGLAILYLLTSIYSLWKDDMRPWIIPLSATLVMFMFYFFYWIPALLSLPPPL